MGKKAKIGGMFGSLMIAVVVAGSCGVLTYGLPFFHDVTLGKGYAPTLKPADPAFKKYVGQFPLLRLPAKIDVRHIDFQKLKTVKTADFNRWASKPSRIRHAGEVLDPRAFAAVDFGGSFGLIHVHKTYDDARGYKTLYFTLSTYSGSGKERGMEVIALYQLGEETAPVLDYLVQLRTIDRIVIGKNGRIIVERKKYERLLPGETTGSIFEPAGEIIIGADGTISRKHKNASRRIKRDE